MMMETSLNKTRKKRKQHDAMSPNSNMCIMKLRRIQSITQCSTSTMLKVLDAVQPRAVKSLTKTDKSFLLASGTECLRLHGCVVCDKHVFHPKSKFNNCPLCNHPRYTVNKKPNEVSDNFFMLVYT